jgi:hypothetical protein
VIFGVDFSPCEAFSSGAEGLIRALCVCLLVSSARPGSWFSFSGARVRFSCLLPKPLPSAAVGVPVFARSPVHLAFLCCFCLATDAHSIPIARLVSWPPIHSSPCARVRLLIWLHADRFSLRFSSPLAAFTGPRTGIRPDDFESSHPVFLAVVSAWTPGCRLPFFFSRWISSQELPLRRS